MRHWLSRIKTLLRTVTKKFHKKKKNMAKNNLKIVKKYIYIYPSEENFVMELLSITLWLLLEFQCQCQCY